MDEILVSVVIPIYNVEIYLRQCVDSVRSQTYRNIEIILVDDGSPDYCPAICDEYEKLDPRVRVVHKANGGLSDARNAGTAIARGEYIAYVDSDDWITPDYIEVLMRLIVANHAEMAVCGAKRAMTRDATMLKRKSKTYVLTGMETLEKMLYQNGIDTGAWARMTKTSVVRRYPFPKGKLFEDLGTTYKYLSDCQHVVLTDKKLYFYYQNPTSITRSAFNAKRLDIISIIDELATQVLQKYPAMESAVMSRKFSAYSYALRQLSGRTSDYEQLQTHLWKFIKDYRWMMLLDKNARVKNRLAALAAYLGCKIYQRL